MKGISPKNDMKIPLSLTFLLNGVAWRVWHGARLAQLGLVGASPDATAWLGWAWLSLVWLGLAWLGLDWLGLAWLGFA